MPYLRGEQPGFLGPGPQHEHASLCTRQNSSRPAKEPSAIAICMNPSCTDETKTDKSAIRLVDAGKALGYPGWVMLNIYPERCPNPKTLTNFDAGF